MGDNLAPCLTLLMDYSEINIRDANLYTELHQAAKYGNIGHIDILVHYGADMSAENSLGNSPLHLAASQGRVKAVQLLLLRGADKNAVNHQGNPPNQVAIICGHHNISSIIVNFSSESAGVCVCAVCVCACDAWREKFLSLLLSQTPSPLPLSTTHTPGTNPRVGKQV